LSLDPFLQALNNNKHAANKLKNDFFIETVFNMYDNSAKLDCINTKKQKGCSNLQPEIL